MRLSAPTGFTRPRLLVTVLAIVASVGLTAQLAGATIVERGRYADTWTDTYSDCGFPVSVSGQVSGHYRIRQGKGRTASAFFLHDRFSYREVHTNLQTGQSFVVRGSVLFHETRARRVSGNIFEFVAIEAGQPFVIEDASGRVVVRDRGVIRYRILFDTLGDDEPGGEIITEFEPSVRGPHPGFADDFPFCEYAARLTGATP